MRNTSKAAVRREGTHQALDLLAKGPWCVEVQRRHRMRKTWMVAARHCGCVGLNHYWIDRLLD